MDRIYEILYKMFMDELNDLAMGHPYNKSRLSYMRATVTLLMYLQYADLKDIEILTLLQSYEHI